MHPLTQDEALVREAEAWLSDLAAAQGRFDHLPLSRDGGVRRRLDHLRWRFAAQEVGTDIGLVRNPGYGRVGSFDQAHARGRLSEFRAGLYRDGTIAELTSLSHEIEVAETEQRQRVTRLVQEWSSWATELSKGFAHLAQVPSIPERSVASAVLQSRSATFAKRHAELSHRAAMLATSKVCASGSCATSHAALEQLMHLFEMVRDALPTHTVEKWAFDVARLVHGQRQTLISAQGEALSLADEAQRVEAIATHLAEVNGEDLGVDLMDLVAETPAVRRAATTAGELVGNAICASGRCNAAHPPEQWEAAAAVSQLPDLVAFRRRIGVVQRAIDLRMDADCEIVRRVRALRTELDDLLGARRHPPFGGEAPRIAASDVIPLQHVCEELDGLLADAARSGDTELCLTGQCSRAHPAVLAMGRILGAVANPELDDWSAGADALHAGRELHRVGVMEREALAQVCIGMSAAADKIREGLRIAEVLPLTQPSDAMGQEDRAALSALVERIVEWVEAGRALSGPREHARCREGTCQHLHASAVELAAFLDGPAVEQLSAAALLLGRAAGQSDAERHEVEISLAWARDLMPPLDRASRLSQHLNINRSGSAAAALMVQGALERLGPALRLAEDLPAHDCDGHVRCRPIHDAARDLTQLRRGDADSSWGSAVKLLEDEFEADLRETEDLLAQLSELPVRAREFTRRVASAEETVARLIDAHSRGADVWLGSHEVRVTPMSDLKVALVRLQHLDAVKTSRGVVEKGQELIQAASSARIPHASAADAVSNLEPCADGHAEVLRLSQQFPGIAAALDSAEAEFLSEIAAPTWEQLNTPRLSSWMPSHTRAVEIFSLRAGYPAAMAVQDAESQLEARQSDARTAARAVHARDVSLRLSDMGLDVLRKAADLPIRAKALEAHGLQDVASILEFGDTWALAGLEGLGFDSAWTIYQAALRLEVAEREDTPLRIDVKARSAETQRLLESLAAWDAARAHRPDAEVYELAEAVLRGGSTGHALVTVAGPHPVGDVPGVIATLRAAAAPSAVAGDSIGDVWDDFLSRPAAFFGLIAELGFVTEDEQKMHGDLPEEVVAAVRDVVLRRDHLTARLRAYQAFGARYALAQRKVVIGDEMGLGKTVEALAVLAHRRAVGATHFIVVCPAAVVSNWMVETRAHTSLTPRRLHGPAEARRSAIHEWARSGGVAVTTFDLLGHLGDALADVDLDTVVIDEAHYIKNPQALRSVRAATLVHQARYAVLMTGTPMENHPDEFRNLVDYVQPDVAAEAPTYHPAAFRKHLAPVYLRRNQEDVLTELPEVVEVEEWLPCELNASAAYRAAVSSGDFAAMRQAGMADGGAKMHRLAELVEEAVANRRKVIVFSYFRDVLTKVARQLETVCPVFGPMTGSTPAGRRQDLVDAFTSWDGGGVLVAQIVAGGVGLNIQAASVVVICEPQLKPTLEDQAVARAHRMGQTQTVQVHRLLDEDGIDRRIRQILSEKRELFDDYARRSVIVEGSPDAVDVSDTEIARQVVAEERKRLHLLDRR